MCLYWPPHHLTWSTHISEKGFSTSSSSGLDCLHDVGYNKLFSKICCIIRSKDEALSTCQLQLYKLIESLMEKHYNFSLPFPCFSLPSPCFSLPFPGFRSSCSLFSSCFSHLSEDHPGVSEALHYTCPPSCPFLKLLDTPMASSLLALPL